MAYISYNKLWGSEFDSIACKTDKLQDLNFNQIKPELHDSYKRMKNEQHILNLLTLTTL